MITDDRKRPVELDDPDNPEWTEADFARAKGPASLPAEVLAAFPRTQVNRGGRPKVERPKVPVSARLDPDLAEPRASIWGMDNATTQIAVSLFIERFLLL